MTFSPVELRLRTWIGDAELDAKKGKIVGRRDFNVTIHGPARVLRPDGTVLAVYMPGVLQPELAAAWPVLSSIRLITDNRGMAAGTPRAVRGDQKRTRTRRIMSGVIGAVDPGPATGRATGRLPACRLTAWTGKHLPEWHDLRPVFQAIDRHYAEQVPDRYARQWAVAAQTHPDWRIPDTAFTTVTVNNSYSTGVHQDAGDLPDGFSTLAVARRGAYTGGELVLPRYRIAFDLADGDLLLFDAHEWHGNTNMWCPHTDTPLYRPCPEGCERVSLVTYFRTKVQHCASADDEAAKVLAAADAAAQGQPA